MCYLVNLTMRHMPRDLIKFLQSYPIAQKRLKKFFTKIPIKKRKQGIYIKETRKRILVATKYVRNADLLLAIIIHEKLPTVGRPKYLPNFLRYHYQRSRAPIN